MVANRIDNKRSGKENEMKKWKSVVVIWMIATVFLGTFPTPFCAYGQETPENLYAGSAVLMDGDTGRVLYGKAEEEIRPMASTTKIMTCILALEMGDGQESVSFSSKAASQPEVHLGAKKGETFYLKDLLYSLMLESHNDTAVAVAEKIGGTVEEFCRWMNEKAREIGCENTCFLTPNGLDGAETKENGTKLVHSTTAADLAKIMAYCVWKSPKRNEFLEITRTRNYSFSNLENSRVYSCYNHNAYLEMDGDAISGKTGFTGGAGYCYVAAIESEGRHFTMALLGCGWPPHKTYKWSDMRKLAAYGREHFHKESLDQEIQLPGIPVTGGIADSGDPAETVSVPVMVSGTLMDSQVLLGDGEQVQVRKKLEKSLAAPVKKGQKVGEITYQIGDWVVERVPLAASMDISAYTYSWCFRRVVTDFFQ